MTDDEEMSPLVEFTRMVELEETPVPRGPDGPTEVKVLVLLPYGAPLVVLVDRPLEGPVTMGMVVFEVETPVVEITDDETVDEVVLFTVRVFEPVDSIEDPPKGLVQDTVEVLGTSLLEVIEEPTLLLLELSGASLILRAPLTPLLVVGLPSLFFM